MTTDDIENFSTEVVKTIKDWFVNAGFKDRKLTDTPTDALQVANKGYVDSQITTPEWTFISSKTVSSSSATQSFTSLASYNYYKIRFNITKSTGTGAINLGVQVNNNNGALNYGVSLINFAGTVSSGSGSNWQIYAAGAAGTAWYIGEYIIKGKVFNATNYKGIFGSGIGSENGGTDTYLVRGTTNDNANITSIQIITTDAYSGTIELWGRNNS